MRHGAMLNGSLALMLGACALPAAAQDYTFRDLGSLVGDSTARGISPRGRVVGISDIGHDSKATLWRRERAIDLTPAGNICYAWGINRHEHIVGSCRTKASNSRAVEWVDGIAVDLPKVPNTQGFAKAIDADGVIVGYVMYPTGRTRAAKWTEMGLVDLGIPPQGSSAALAVSGSGKIVGQGYDGSNNAVALVWEQGNAPPAVLPWDGSGSSYGAYGTNGSGQVVGSGYENFREIPARWDGTVLTRLAVLNGGSAAAIDINNSGVAVGTCTVDYPFNKKYHAVRWATDASVTDLNDLVDDATRQAGWVLEAATGINENGQIVGRARNRLTGVTHAFLLTPPS